MKYGLFFLSIGCLMACNNSTTPDGKITDTSSTKTDAPKMDTATAAASMNSTTCYAYQTATDTVKLSLTTKGQNVSGNLIQAFSGKDKNSGTLAGAMRGDTLFADYNFASEGKTSVRQIAFLKKEAGFVEGYGDVKTEGTKMVFKNTGALNFGGKMILQKTACQ